jgi:hypothetical protein
MIKSLDEGRIMINKAPLFMVPGGMLMCQEMFQLFVREHPEYKNWQAVQNGFLALGLHSRGADGGATVRFEQMHNQQMQSGIVFSKYAIALPASVKVQHLSGKVESLSAMELTNRANNYNQLQPVNAAVSSLQKLNAAGQWATVDNRPNPLGPGAKHSG